MMNQISEMKHDDTEMEVSDNDGDIVDKIEERMHDEVNVLRENKIPLLNNTTAGHDFVWQPDRAHQETYGLKNMLSSMSVKQGRMSTWNHRV